jgi:hypothetical protein
LKIYADETIHSTRNDMLVSIARLLIENQHDKDEGYYRKAYKDYCNAIRKLLNINKILNFKFIDGDFSELIIVTYDIEATNDNFYEYGCDENGDYMQSHEMNTLTGEEFGDWQLRNT